MAYNRTKWRDHVVERPRTFTEVTNADGSVTHTPAPGQVLQQGTPQSATNFNNIEEALQHFSVAFDWLCCIVQGQEREITTLKDMAVIIAPKE